MKKFNIEHTVPDRAEEHRDRIVANIEEGIGPCLGIDKICALAEQCEFCVLNDPWTAEVWLASLPQEEKVHQVKC